MIGSVVDHPGPGPEPNALANPPSEKFETDRDEFADLDEIIRDALEDENGDDDGHADDGDHTTAITERGLESAETTGKSNGWPFHRRGSVVRNSPRSDASSSRR